MGGLIVYEEYHFCQRWKDIPPWVNRTSLEQILFDLS